MYAKPRSDGSPKNCPFNDGRLCTDKCPLFININHVVGRCSIEKMSESLQSIDSGISALESVLNHIARALNE